MNEQLIVKYFPKLSAIQETQFKALGALYTEWNAKINVISRKDIDHLYLHHVLHSCVIAKYISFIKGTKILDAGCGGGFPGVPLAILFPEVEFHLVDSIRKKLLVVEAIKEAIGLENIKTTHIRAEELKRKYDFVISRAVAALPKLLEWTSKNIRKEHKNGIPNGLIALKGGDLKEEIKQVRKRYYVEQTPVSNYFEEAYFSEKYIIYVQGH